MNVAKFKINFTLTPITTPNEDTHNPALKSDPQYQNIADHASQQLQFCLFV
jgi:hypothetical protein